MSVQRIKNQMVFLSNILKKDILVDKNGDFFIEEYDNNKAVRLIQIGEESNVAHFNRSDFYSIEQLNETAYETIIFNNLPVEMRLNSSKNAVEMGFGSGGNAVEMGFGSGKNAVEVLKIYGKLGKSFEDWDEKQQLKYGKSIDFIISVCENYKEYSEVYKISKQIEKIFTKIWNMTCEYEPCSSTIDKYFEYRTSIELKSKFALRPILTNLEKREKRIKNGIDSKNKVWLKKLWRMIIKIGLTVLSILTISISIYYFGFYRKNKKSIANNNQNKVSEYLNNQESSELIKIYEKSLNTTFYEWRKGKLNEYLLTIEIGTEPEIILQKLDSVNNTLNEKF